MAISETGRHGVLGCLPLTYLLWAKPSDPSRAPDHVGLSGKSQGLPPARVSLANKHDPESGHLRCEPQTELG